MLVLKLQMNDIYNIIVLYEINWPYIYILFAFLSYILILSSEKSVFYGDFEGYFVF